MISGIILASGHALRMGKQQKLLLNIGNKPMVERVIETVKASRINEIILVYQDPRIKSIGKSNGLTTVYNPNSKDGQSTSIRAGIRAARSDSKGFMFFVGDQPFLQVDIINRLLEVFEEENYSIVQPVYDEQRGNPVLFHKKFRKDLLNIKGDTGGRSIIGENMEDVCFVKFDNPIFGKDIDTWEVYEEFRDRG